jgi:hypothetical protein
MTLQLSAATVGAFASFAQPRSFLLGAEFRGFLAVTGRTILAHDKFLFQTRPETGTASVNNLEFHTEGNRCFVQGAGRGHIEFRAVPLGLALVTSSVG